jgi:hypothetical protein
MTTKRLILGIVAVFVSVWATSFLIHGVWLLGTYKATMNLWRTEAEMTSHVAWLFLGQFLMSVAFVVIWSKGFPATATLGGSCGYGLFMGVFSQATTCITYAVQPVPGDLMVKWFVSGLAQGVLMGVIVWLAGKPKAAEGTGQR